MNRLLIVLVIAFVSYSQGAPENGAELPTSYSEFVSLQGNCNTQASVVPELEDEYEGGEYVESYEIGYGNFTGNGYSDITLKFHTAPHGVVKLESLPIGKIWCAAKCAVSCFKGKKTASCVVCMAKCALK